MYPAVKNIRLNLAIKHPLLRRQTAVGPLYRDNTLNSLDTCLSTVPAAFVWEVPECTVITNCIVFGHKTKQIRAENPVRRVLFLASDHQPTLEEIQQVCQLTPSAPIEQKQAETEDGELAELLNGDSDTLKARQPTYHPSNFYYGLVSRHVAQLQHNSRVTQDSTLPTGNDIFAVGFIDLDDLGSLTPTTMKWQTPTVRTGLVAFLCITSFHGGRGSTTNNSQEEDASFSLPSELFSIIMSFLPAGSIPTQFSEHMLESQQQPRESVAQRMYGEVAVARPVKATYLTSLVLNGSACKKLLSCYYVGIAGVPAADSGPTLPCSAIGLNLPVPDDQPPAAVCTFAEG
eukprot:TRINITY_DN67265_c5_g1_i1.p1 TRINITY_DN67265_c5_g1~~TRINITY_DN67265_c5_g1_i1.p1  ORF type:complete len:345 (+),score=20.33 TRINITY_DN67265_c5_g1_i1:3-1037(+)